MLNWEERKSTIYQVTMLLNTEFRGSWKLMHECIINQIIYISRICFKRKKLAFVSSEKKYPGFLLGKKARLEEKTQPPPAPGPPPPPPENQMVGPLTKYPPREDHSSWYNGMFADNDDTNPCSLCINRCALKLDQLAKPTLRSCYARTIFGHGTEWSTLKHGTPRLHLLRVPFLTQRFH